jgi:hypothetical protein
MNAARRVRWNILAGFGAGVALGLLALYFARPMMLYAARYYGMMVVLWVWLGAVVALEIPVFVAIRRNAVAFREGLLTGIMVSLFILIFVARWFLR